MNSLFLTVLNMSLTASFAALAVMIVRMLFKKLPKIFSYALWAVVLFRLICPFSFESALSLLPNNTESIPQEIIYMQNPSINIGIKMIDNTVNKSIETSLPPVNPAASVNPMGVISEICSIIWVIGIIVLLTYGVITYFKLKHRLSTATLVHDNIYETDRIKTAFVLGLIKPRIILPTNLSGSELSYIVKHEETHIKRFDYIIKPVAYLALVFHWFNPVIWLSYYLMVKDMEMSCDESVMKNTSEDIRANYSSSLLTLSAKQSGLLSPLAFGEGNVKTRIKNVLNYKRPSFWIVILAVIILIFILISFGTDSKNIEEQPKINASVSANNTNLADGGIVYENKTLGFSLMFPKEWENKYSIEESNDYISVFDKKIYDKKQGGLLFTINRTVGELITQEDMDREPVPQKIILQGNGYTYFYRLPTDINYPVNDEELSKDYEAMRDQINDVVLGISLLGDQKPRAANDGFKVVGSSYFTVEIPSGWEIKLFEYFPIWYIDDGDKTVGIIQMMPYETEENSKDNVADNALREYLFNDETFRKINITLYRDYADESMMDKIKTSFKFTGGPYNVIDVESAANTYIARDGVKIFGKIEGFEMENGKPTAVYVNIMKFIPDGPNDNNPNGYSIEDLKYTETYSLDFGVNAALLVPPDYTSYKMYYMPLIDENFINNYDYKNLFYDFIIGSDGQLKIVLGHYIP